MGLMHLQDIHPNTCFLMGNHDLSLCAELGVLTSDWLKEKAGRTFNKAYRQATFKSYGYKKDSGEHFRSFMPEKHQTWLATLPWVFEQSEHVFVHAGLSNKIDIDTQLKQLRNQ